MRTCLAFGAGLWLAALTPSNATPAFTRGLDVSVLAGPRDQDGAVEAETVGAAIEAYGDVAYMLANGLEVGAGAGVVAGLSNPARGLTDPCFGPGCSLAPGAIAPSAAPPAARPGRAYRAEIDAIYVFVRGGWGEASLGRDLGAAERFAIAPPQLFRGASLADPLVDPAGWGGIGDAGLSGSSLKATVSSVRLLGLSAGLSYAPEREGVDIRGPAFRGGPPGFAAQDIWEGGLSFARPGPRGLDYAIGLTHSIARPGRAGLVFDDASRSSIGASIGRGEAWSAAVRAESGEGGLRGPDSWRAIAGGWTMRVGAWKPAVEFLRVSDDAAKTDLAAVRAGARYALTPHVSLAASLDWAERETNIGASRRQAESRGALFEISWGL
jgi:hypothetical protein